MGFLVTGLLAGVFSGVVGLGGGIILVPALVYFFGFQQHMAQGTTLAMMLPPIGILAVWHYYQHGQIHVKAATWLVLGFVFGGYFGAKIALWIPAYWMKKMFSSCLVAIGIYMFLN